jgi:hypothetical protein
MAYTAPEWAKSQPSVARFDVKATFELAQIPVGMPTPRHLALVLSPPYISISAIVVAVASVQATKGQGGLHIHAGTTAAAPVVHYQRACI